MSNAPRVWAPSLEHRYGSGVGSPAGRLKAVAWNGAIASAVMTHGEMQVERSSPGTARARHLPALDVACRPVVEEAEPHICHSRVDGNRFAPCIARADQDPESKFEIEASVGPKRTSLPFMHWPWGRGMLRADPD